jgi:alpha-acetolactate decarboxylase
MTLIDYSKALYHLKNLEASVLRANNNINTEDLSIQFIYNCMKEKVLKCKHEKEYRSIIDSYFDNEEKVYKINTKERFFYVFKNKEAYLKTNLKEGTLKESFPVFITEEKRLFLPANEIDALRKPYIYAGRYPVLIGIKHE